MKGDFSKNSFDKTKNYSSVRMQQGRVQLDSDWNEQMDIWNHRIQTETIDFIGGSGTPEENEGYKVTPTADQKDLMIQPGRYYVNGILCELEGVDIEGNPIETRYTNQIDNYPEANLPSDPGRYLAYLDVWQKSISSVEDEKLKEEALDGVDTTTRVKNIAQVKLARLTGEYLNADSDTLRDSVTEVVPDLPLSTGTLQPFVDSTSLKFGNQLYRIEIHRGGNFNEATFKWSRDNAFVARKIKEVLNNSIILKETRDEASDEFQGVNWVELTTKKRELYGEPGIFIRLKPGNVVSDQLSFIEETWPVNEDRAEFVGGILRAWSTSSQSLSLLDNNLFIEIEPDVTGADVDENGVLEISLDNGETVSATVNPGHYVELSNEVWENSNQVGVYARIVSIDTSKTKLVVSVGHSLNVEDNVTLIRFLDAAEVPINEDDQITIERGLSIKFSEGDYKTGDYWLITTRSRSNAIVGWQMNENVYVAELARGIKHHYAALGTLTLDQEDEEFHWNFEEDIRFIFSPLTTKAYQSAKDAPGRSIYIDENGDVSITDGSLTIVGDLTVNNITNANQTITGVLNFEDEYGQYINLGSDNYAVGVQTNTQYFRSDDSFAWFVGGSHSEVQFEPGENGTTVMSLNINGLSVQGELDCQKITVDAGSGDVGIQFTANPGIGTIGDIAWIKYYADVGDEGVLELGIQNNPDDHIALMPSGNVGVGTINPQQKLTVNGSLGCTSATINEDLDVSGELNCQKIMLDSGRGNDVGIQFTSDPGGGFGDTAWIKYYAVTGESTVLELGVQNDANDHIALMPSGNVGVGTINPQQKLTVNGSLGCTNITVNGRTISEISVDSTFSGNSNAVVPTEQAVREYVENMLVGSVAAFATTTPPSGWLECNGASVSRSIYSKLFERIGTNFGDGNGSTTFNLPDLRGEFIRGWSRGFFPDSGRDFGTFQEHGFQSHYHNFSGNYTSITNSGSHKHDYPGKYYNRALVGYSISGASFTPEWKDYIRYVSTDLGSVYYESHSHGFYPNGSISLPTTGNSTNETRPRNVALMYCIKY